MIVTPSRRYDPSHDPVGREIKTQRRQSASAIRKTTFQDEDFVDRPGERSKDRLITASQSEKTTLQGYNGGTQSFYQGIKENMTASQDALKRSQLENEQGIMAGKKQDQLVPDLTSTLDEDAILWDERPQRPLSVLQEGDLNGTTSDAGLGEQVDNHKRRRSEVDSTSQTNGKEKVLKLSPERIHEIASSPGSLPLRAFTPTRRLPSFSSLPPQSRGLPGSSQPDGKAIENPTNPDQIGETSSKETPASNYSELSKSSREPVSGQDKLLPARRPTQSARSSSSPSVHGLQTQHLRSGTAERKGSKHTPTPLRFEDGRPAGLQPISMGDMLPSPMPPSIPLPPLSLPTFLQLELSSHRPSALHIHRSATSNFPYESNLAKIERLLNFLLLPPQLEQVLWFGTLACLDAWLYMFTILPLRLLKSFYILAQSWATNFLREIQYVSSFVYTGTGRMWRRRRTRGSSASRPDPARRDSNCSEKPEGLERVHANNSLPGRDENRRPSLNKGNTTDDGPRKSRRHRRTKSVPSALLPCDKADILKGLLIISTCLILMRLDASRMYHWVRGQAAIKLYVIYNILEVGDRLLSALGQDVLECLFSREALERGPDGHSKVLRPFWLFLLALMYTVTHATALFYQVITLNVAVNSYSNALITLLMSNQFVEIKSTVFKKFEKENLFQLTCADVVERFQLWMMLLIIASRNIVETGGLSAGLSALGSPSSYFSPTMTNSSNPQNTPPRSATSILPSSFTLLPNILSSLTACAPGIGHVLGPFLVVLGSEMLVDWLKHCYINKFNNLRPAVYGRFLDVLAKDYYSNAFADQNLTKRLGLPVIPLSCLFIRASVQTYHMFLAVWVPPTLPSSATGLTGAHNHYTSFTASVPTSTTAALSQKFDNLLRQIPASISSSSAFVNFSTILIFVLLFLVLLTVKLVLGMFLLAFARSRYRSMKQREKNPLHHVEGGRRVGGWGVVEVDDDKRRWIYEDDPEGARQLREREEREQARREQGTGEIAFEKVKRYEMAAKRIW